jgi:nucleoside-diphosphate-sugar epimerase
MCFAVRRKRQLNNNSFDIRKYSSFLVTGASGLIGSAIIRLLNKLDEKENLGLHIIPFARQAFGDVRNPENFEKIASADYIFHCAGITKSSEMVKYPADVMSVAVEGTKNVLELAKRVGSKSVVYLSSMEVYGQIDGEVFETDLGYLDLSNPRSSYPESKRASEMLCTSYYRQYGVPVKIARLAQTFGAYVPKDDNRIFSQFARSVITKSDIVLHTTGESVGNYCETTDTCNALMTLLTLGKDGEFYNISNPENTMTIYNMAEMLSKEYGISVNVEIPENADKLGYAKKTGFILNIDKMKNLGWEPKYSLSEMYKQLIGSLIKQEN